MPSFRVRPWLARQLGIPVAALVPVGEVVTQQGARELRYLRSGQYVVTVLVATRSPSDPTLHLDAMWPDGQASMELEPGSELLP